MSNKFPAAFGDRIIPTVEEERPVLHVRGNVLANEALHCRPEHLWPQGVKEAKPEWIRPMAVYLANYCKPIQSIAKEIKCIACDLTVTGHNVLLADWRYKNNIVYENSGTMEGRCTGCGYPCRLDHKIFMPNGGPLLVHVPNFPLFYHPSALETKH